MSLPGESSSTAAESITAPLTSSLNSFTSAITGAVAGSDSDLPDSVVDSGGAESGYSIWSIISGILIVLIIWVLIFNLFNLGQFTGWVESVLAWIGYSTGETVKTTANVGAAGLKGGADVASSAITGSVNILEKGLNLTPQEKIRAQNQQQAQATALNPQPLNPEDVETSEDNVLSTGLANLKKFAPMPSPDDATSVTQSGGRSKSGYCYIGEDRGFRSCIKVGENDQCMSGDIFPTMDICINPNLRA
jgi:hypothetical protein